MRSARYALSCALLHKGDFEAAKAENDLLLELANTQNARSYLVLGGLLKIRLALNAPHLMPHDAESYWRQLEDYINQLIAENAPALGDL